MRKVVFYSFLRWLCLLGFSTLCVVGSPTVSSLSVESLAQTCGARSNRAGHFRPPPDYATKKRMKAAGSSGSSSTVPQPSVVAALESSLRKVCKREAQLRAAYYESAKQLRLTTAAAARGVRFKGSAAGMSAAAAAAKAAKAEVITTTAAANASTITAGGVDPHGGRVLRSASEALQPELLSVFCGHELCPTEPAATGRDFGCRQTERCLCYLRATSVLPSATEEAAKEHSWVHVFWSGAPDSTVVRRFAASFARTQDQSALSLVVWYRTPGLNGLAYVQALAEALKPFSTKSSRRLEEEEKAPISSSSSRRSTRRKKHDSPLPLTARVSDNEGDASSSWPPSSSSSSSPPSSSKSLPELDAEEVAKLGCDLDDRATTRIHVCLLGPEQLELVSRGTIFEGHPPATYKHKRKRGGGEKNATTTTTTTSFADSLASDPDGWQRLSPRALSDYLRFVLLARFGGLYLDADSVLLRDLTPLLEATAAPSSSHTSSTADSRASALQPTTASATAPATAATIDEEGGKRPATDSEPAESSSARLQLPYDFSSFWGVQGYLNTGAALRFSKGSPSARALFTGLIDLAGGGGGGGGGRGSSSSSSSSSSNVSSSSSSSNSGRTSSGGLSIHDFHPKAVTKVAKAKGLFEHSNARTDTHKSRSGGDSSDSDSGRRGRQQVDLRLVPLSLAFFEPAWCQPVHTGYLVPSIKELHSSDTFMGATNDDAAVDPGSTSSTTSSNSFPKSTSSAVRTTARTQAAGTKTKAAREAEWEQRVAAVRACGAFAIHYHRAAESESAAAAPSSSSSSQAPPLLHAFSPSTRSGEGGGREPGADSRRKKRGAAALHASPSMTEAPLSTRHQYFSSGRNAEGSATSFPSSPLPWLDALGGL